MFILNFINLKDNHEVDTVLDEQRAFLERYIQSGVFLVAGRKVPRTGGIIVAQGINRQQLDAIVAEAPFARHGFARIEVTEFNAVYCTPGLQLSAIEAV
jgi:uncharacterized protein YciI